MKGGSHEWFGHLTPDRFPSLISSSPLMRSAALRSRAVDLGGCDTGTLSRSQAQAETCGPRRDPPRSLAGGLPEHICPVGPLSKVPRRLAGGCAPRPGVLETFVGHHSMATKHRSEMPFGVLGDWSPNPCYPPEFSKSYKELRYLYHRVPMGTCFGGPPRHAMP